MSDTTLWWLGMVIIFGSLAWFVVRVAKEGGFRS